MNKRRDYLIAFLIVLFISIGIGYAYLETDLNINSNVHLKGNKPVIIYYLNNIKQDAIPTKNNDYIYDDINSTCTNNATITWDNDNWKVNINNITKKPTCSIYFNEVKYCNEENCYFDYTGTYQVFIAPKDGTYKLEIWGASSGEALRNNILVSELKSKGGYSQGTVSLKKSDLLYISIGGKGENGKYKQISHGGYNGGGNGIHDFSDDEATAGGGGATSIQNKLINDCRLKSYEKYLNNILIVAGGGGSLAIPTAQVSINNLSKGSNGGGISGGNGITYNGDVVIKGGNQSNGYKFGEGQNASNCINCELGAGGGGYYGGFSQSNVEDRTNYYVSGGGGSGYIGNSLLTNKHMACYNCETSDEESTKTISVTCANETPTEDCAKIGNGYAKITYISS